MKKIICLIWGISFILVGCANTSDLRTNEGDIETTFERINIYEYYELPNDPTTMEYQDNLIITITNKKYLAKIEKMFSNGEKVSGLCPEECTSWVCVDCEITTATSPKYALEIINQDFEILHIIDLWPSEALTIISYQNMARENYYALSPADTKVLLSILETKISILP